mgnify:CR=1 FL=1
MFEAHVSIAASYKYIRLVTTDVDKISIFIFNLFYSKFILFKIYFLSRFSQRWKLRKTSLRVCEFDLIGFIIPAKCFDSGFENRYTVYTYICHTCNRKEKVFIKHRIQQPASRPCNKDIRNKSIIFTGFIPYSFCNQKVCKA